MAHEFIYTCYKLARHYPPDRTVLENISLSFYPGAKIGVIGGNGAGKSSLLKIMAGLDDGYSGEARLTPGFTVGYLAQEPELDPTKDVRGNVMDGVAEVQSIIDRYNEVMAMWADPDADYDKIGKEQAVLEDRIAATDAWSLDRNVEIAMDALRCPPDDADVTTLSGGERRRVALCRLLLSRPDLLLLDIMLPNVDGMTLCREIRKHGDLPVIMLTARSEEIDRLLGLELGADDYVCKPFSPRELIARVKVVLRRGASREDAASGERLVRGDMEIDIGRFVVRVADQPINLTPTEMRLLHFLASHPGRVFPRAHLLSRVIGEDAIVTDRNIDVHIRALRQKLGEHSDFIETVRGVGYRFAEVPA